MFAGLDIGASFVGLMINFLGENLCRCQQLIEKPEVIFSVIGKFLRRFPMVTMIRTAAQDFGLDVVPIKAGGLVALPSILVYLISETYPDPLSVDINRPSGSIATFGNRPHHCPGSPLARLEVRVILEEWLKRICRFRPCLDRCGTIRRRL